MLRRPSPDFWPLTGLTSPLIQAGFGQNTHSFIGDPLFTSATDLHITSVSSPVSNTGTAIAGVPVDFDGVTRSESLPDMGADEFGASVPPTITTPTQTAITANTATLGGNVTSDGGAAITERGVVYSVTSANNNPLIGGSGVTKVTSAGTLGVFTVSATGLTSGTGYSFKAYAINSAGTAYTTPVSTFTTLASPTVTLNTANLAQNAPTMTIAGTNFSTTPANNTVAFSLGAVGNVTAATATQLTVTFTTQPTSTGSLTAVVTSNGGTSGAAVQVATIVAAPTVTANSGSRAQNAPTMTIAGTNFSTTPANNTVAFSLGAIGNVTAADGDATDRDFLDAADGSTGNLTAVVTSTAGAAAAVQVATSSLRRRSRRTRRISRRTRRR